LRSRRRRLAIGFAVSAGPVSPPCRPNTAALKQVDVNNVIDVQWGRRGFRRGAGPWVAGAALGIIGGVIASQAYQNNYYYNDGYAYGPYGYGMPYAVQPSYGYAPYGYAPYGGYPPYRSCDNASTC
jgi:hypothetical protein